VSTGPVGQSRVSETSAQARGRRRLSVQRRRDELIEVALELYSRHPGHQVSIEDVADAAGASRALVYHYFGGKRGLQLAALAAAADQFTAALPAPAPRRAGEQLRQQLEGLVGRYLDHVEGHAAGFAALQRSAATHRHDELGGHVHRVRQVLFEWLLATVGPTAPPAATSPPAATGPHGPGGPYGAAGVQGAAGVEGAGGRGGVEGAGVRADPLRLTLWAWIGAAETATLDWLETGAMDRGRLQRLLAGYLVVMLRTAGSEDGALAGRLGAAF
jgi:AcrR family transcriptional regulator